MNDETRDLLAFWSCKKRGADGKRARPGNAVVTDAQAQELLKLSPMRRAHEARVLAMQQSKTQGTAE